MTPEPPDRRKRNPGGFPSHVQSIDRRSGTWSGSSTPTGKISRGGFQDKTVRTVGPDTSTSASTLGDARAGHGPGPGPTSPVSLGPGNLDKRGLDPTTSFYHAPEDVQILANPQSSSTKKIPSDETSCSSSQTSLLSKTRARLNSVTATHPLSSKAIADSSNSIGYPSIIPSPTSSHNEGGTYTGSRRPRRLRKPARSTGSADVPRYVEGMELRLPSMRTTGSSAILPLMKTTCGRMHGFLYFRPANSTNWSSGHCCINVTSGSLIHQPKGESGHARILIPDLRGCSVRTLYDADGECNYLSVITASSGLRLNLWPPVAETFESWLAALLCWQPIPPKGVQNKMIKPQTLSMADRRASDKSRGSESSGSRNPAIVKVGKMLLRDCSTDTGPLRPITPRRVSTYKQLRAISRSWQRVSCTLLEDGRFKLLTESDAQVISKIHLPSLSRCAVQQLHPSVLEDEYCLAIYPQYVAQSHDDIQSKPICLSVESRVLFEVWFVLLRAFTISELYGPEQVMTGPQHRGRGQVHSFPSTLNHGLFRVERSMSIKITEVKLALRSGQDTVREYPYRLPNMTEIGPDSAFYTEIVLDGEPRGRTSARPRNFMFWMEEFMFSDLPPVLSSASILLKVLNPDERSWNANAGISNNLSHADDNSIMVDESIEAPVPDTVLGHLELQLGDLEQGCEIDRRLPLLDSTDTPIGHSLMKLRLTETVVLMKEDYASLLDLLRSLSNGLTVTIAKIIPGELKLLSEIFLDIFQVSGDASEWLMTLVEDEIDGAQEVSVQRLRFKNRIHSSESFESAEDREIVVRDLGRSAKLEANLLFRGNTLLTKALDAHMRRLGREYLEETIGERLRDIDESDPDCEVDPSKLRPPQDLNRNWGNLIALTTNLWTAISSSASRCPTELRQLFRHIKSCAETRYGDFLRTVTYSSVSGFLFLRFFCPAILNPSLFGLLKDAPRQRAQRTLILIAKSLQGLANMSTFGKKEPWMEPMNQFLHASRPEFKAFVDQICAIPSERPSQAVSASYATPIQILGRLSPMSREGFASLPYLIDSPKKFANLVSLWMERQPSDLDPKFEKDNALHRFHGLCVEIHQRTNDCINNAEPAAKPSSRLEPEWERVLKEREKPTTFYEDSASVPITPLADIDPELPGPSDISNLDWNCFPTRPLSPSDVAGANQRRATETPSSSTTVPRSHKWPIDSQSRPAGNKESNKSYHNSSTSSSEIIETYQMQSSSAGRDVPPKSRLFKDFVSDSARRQGREDIDDEHFLKHHDF